MKRIKGFEDYFIAEDGRVISTKNKGYKELRLFPNSRGYMRVRLCRRGVLHTKRVHRAVAEAFVPNPESKPDVHHIDGDKHNNHYTNLGWVTKSENACHAFRMGFRVGCKGSKNGSAKLTEPEIMEIKEMLRDGALQRAIAKKFGVTQTYISDVKTGRTWSHVT